MIEWTGAEMPDTGSGAAWDLPVVPIGGSAVFGAGRGYALSLRPELSVLPLLSLDEALEVAGLLAEHGGRRARELAAVLTDRAADVL